MSPNHPTQGIEPPLLPSSRHKSYSRKGSLCLLQYRSPNHLSQGIKPSLLSSSRPYKLQQKEACVFISCYLDHAVPKALMQIKGSGLASGKLYWKQSSSRASVVQTQGRGPTGHGNISYNFFFQQFHRFSDGFPCFVRYDLGSDWESCLFPSILNLNSGMFKMLVSSDVLWKLKAGRTVSHWGLFFMIIKSKPWEKFFISFDLLHFKFIVVPMAYTFWWVLVVASPLKNNSILGLLVSRDFVSIFGWFPYSV